MHFYHTAMGHKPGGPSTGICPENASRWRVAIYPPTYSFPELVEYFPPEKEDPAATVTGAAAPEPEPPESSRCCPEAPCHHHAQGVSVNPFGYPPLSDIGAPSGPSSKGPFYTLDISPICPNIRERGIPKGVAKLPGRDVDRGA